MAGPIAASLAQRTDLGARDFECLPVVKKKSNRLLPPELMEPGDLEALDALPSVRDGRAAHDAPLCILLLVGALPNWGYSRSWGYGPSGGFGVVVVVIVVLLVMGVL